MRTVRYPLVCAAIVIGWLVGGAVADAARATTCGAPGAAFSLSAPTDAVRNVPATPANFNVATGTAPAAWVVCCCQDVRGERCCGYVVSCGGPIPGCWCR